MYAIRSYYGIQLHFYPKSDHLETVVGEDDVNKVFSDVVSYNFV